MRPRGVDTNECECVWGGHYMHGMCEHELALFILLCTRIQKEANTGGEGRGGPQSPLGIHTLAPNVLVHTTLDMFVCLCTSLNVLGGVQNTTKVAAPHSY